MESKRKIEDQNFCAVDFETATYSRMACQVGITIVEHGEIKDTIKRLIQPPGNLYDKGTIKVHGITPEMTADAPTFDVLWEEISKYFTGRTIVAHNASFDEDVLRKELEYYNIMAFGIEHFVCTYHIYGYSLSDLCEAFSICCDCHHDAGFDSRCCAQFYLNYLNGVLPKFIATKKKEKKTKSSGGHKALYGDILVKDLSEADPTNPFYDRTVVITGTFPIERRELAKMIKSMGADINTSISKYTNFVVIGDEPGPAKMEKIEKLIHDGYGIRKIYADDLEKIMRGEWGNYMTGKENSKALDFTYNHYEKHHICFEGKRNIIASKELFFGKDFAPNVDCFMQITGNLGAFGNTVLSSDVNICILSDTTLGKLKKGEKDDTILYIQDFYNSNKAVSFDYKFMSESDILDWCKRRCEVVGNDVTMCLYNQYMKSK